jgi:hypothetical protein
MPEPGAEIEHTLAAVQPAACRIVRVGRSIDARPAGRAVRARRVAAENVFHGHTATEECVRSTRANAVAEHAAPRTDGSSASSGCQQLQHLVLEHRHRHAVAIAIAVAAPRRDARAGGDDAGQVERIGVDTA